MSWSHRKTSVPWKPASQKKAEEWGLKSRDLGIKAKVLPSDSLERVKMEREIEDIYTWLKTAPTGEVVTVTLLTHSLGSRWQYSKQTKTLT